MTKAWVKPSLFLGSLVILFLFGVILGESIISFVSVFPAVRMGIWFCFGCFLF